MDRFKNKVAACEVTILTDFVRYLPMAFRLEDKCDMIFIENIKRVIKALYD